MSFNECTKLFLNFDTSVSLENKFFHFVYNKINKNTKNRFVERGQNSIDIIPSNDESIRVIPIFKNMDKNNLMLDTEIAIASKIIQDGEMKCIYFVYPKNENFDKHIQIKVTSLENACSDYMIKIIPYSLRDLYKKGIKNENCNILCK